MSRRARSVSLTRYGTGAPERFQGFARRAYAAFFHIFEALADTFRSVGLRRYIEQPLTGFGILHTFQELSKQLENPIIEVNSFGAEDSGNANPDAGYQI